MKQKGIILAGGAGSRLDPLTRVACKQLLPVYDKPMIYYPLSTLMLGGIREVLIISTPKDIPAFQSLLGDGSLLGMRFTYAEQPKPEGIAQAFHIGESTGFLADSDITTLILGDNLFYGRLDFFRKALAKVREQGGACVFGYHVPDPERFGVVEFDSDGTVISIEEKPQQPKSSYAVPGLYVYDREVGQRALGLEPSARGELEITDLNIGYLTDGKLHVELLGRGIAWLDTGTPQSLIDASHFISTIQRQQNQHVACLEEIAYGAGFIDAEGLGACIEATRNPELKTYLKRVLDEPRIV